MKIAGVTLNAVRALCHSEMAGWLSAEEMTRHGCLGKSVATEWLAGRVALKQACLDFSLDKTMPASALVVGNDLMGAPFVGKLEGLHCSISHCGGWGVGAISAQPIGVDIERIGGRPVSLAHYVSELEDIDQLATDEEDPRVLVAKIWIIKEAAMKAWPKGLTLHPKSVKLHRRAPAVFTARAKTRNGRSLVTNVFLYRQSEFLVAVAAGESHDNPPVIHWLDTPLVPSTDTKSGRSAIEVSTSVV